MTKPVLLDYDLAAGVKAFSTTRKGGCSQGNICWVLSLTCWSIPTKCTA